MKKQIIKFWDKIIVVLLGILGVLYNSCLKMYGMPEAPHTAYNIRGVITDKETSNPIQNIQIIRQINSIYGDTLYTDIDGKYAFYNISPEFHLKIEDIDGEENGGYFESKEIDVKFADGEFVKTVNIELETKK
jgi:putative lipoprotein (rSAM/lipoprotein system)